MKFSLTFNNYKISEASEMQFARTEMLHYITTPPLAATYGPRASPSPVWRMWRPAAKFDSCNSLLSRLLQESFILYLKTFCGVSDCILNENSIIITMHSILHATVQLAL